MQVFKDITMSRYTDKTLFKDNMIEADTINKIHNDSKVQI